MMQPKTVFAKIETEILDYWNKNATFQQSVSIREKDKEYVFYDGPPFANGLPHYGHLLTGFVKDIFARYHTMNGEKVERRFGWDCHGLPAEMEAEKELGVSGRIAIAEFGIDKFNDQCRTSVMKYTSEWKDYVTKQARWVDFDGGYRTMDTDYMESVIWAFSELYKKGLVYEDMRVMPYSWKCETPLSNFETKLDNSYREKTSKSVFVKFELESIPDFISKKYPNLTKVFATAWTTTPWTLPSNLALAIGVDIDYVVLVKDNIGYICAKNLQDKIEQMI
jgi:isoleucyl-tRNA synthetase